MSERSANDDQRGRVSALISVLAGILLVAWVASTLAGSLGWLLLGLAGAALVLAAVWLLAGVRGAHPLVGLASGVLGGALVAVAFAQVSLTSAVLISRMSVVVGLAVASAGFGRAAVEARAGGDGSPSEQADGLVPGEAGAAGTGTAVGDSAEVDDEE